MWIFEHNFVADKAKLRRRAVARQVFFTQYAAKFAEKTLVYACEDGFLGETEIEVPQDRDGTFEPKVVKKRQKDISGIEQKIISLYAKGMTTRQISDTIEDIYGFEVSDGMVSDITDRLLPQIEDWQNRPLDAVYPIVFIDAVHFSVRDNGQIRKLAAYVILAVSLTGHKGTYRRKRKCKILARSAE